MQKTRKKQVLLVPGWNYPELNRGLLNYAREFDWELNMKIALHWVLPWGWRGDGVITQLGLSAEQNAFVESLNVPIVDMDLHRHDWKLPRVLQDNEKIGVIAANHFIERGFKQFATYSYNKTGENKLLDERAESFSAYLAEQGYQCKDLRWGDARGERKDTVDGIYRWLGKVLEKSPKPLAVFALNDERGEQVIRACVQARIDIPEQVAVLGVDNLEMISENLPISLSSIDTNLYELGYNAARMLDAIMDGGKVSLEPVRVSPKGIITRVSTDILAVENLNVARALRYIWNHYHQPITVDDIVGITAISRRALEMVFKQSLKRTINEELQRVRIEKVKQLLMNTQKSLYEIQLETGFGTRQHLHRVFSESEGIAPSQYRKKHKR